MKKYFSKIFLLPFFLLSCITTPITSLPDSNLIQTETVVPTMPVTDTSTPEPALPSSISDNLTIVYKVEDGFDLYSIWVWKQDILQKILQQKDIDSPIVSSDGEWIVFQKRNFFTDYNLPTSEVWLMRTDGSDLQLLLSSDELNNLYSDDRILWIDQIGWIPNQDKLLFTTTKNFKDSPGAVLNFDLFSLDLEGQITKLADIEDGGRFTFSPNGKYVAVASTNKIGVIDLETQEKLTSLDFDPFWQACQCYFIPKIFWNVESDFILTSIPPQKLHYSEEYTDEPAKIWKLTTDGDVELFFEFIPLARFSGGIDVSPNFQYLSYFSESCIDGMGRLSILNLETKEIYSHECMWEVPDWSKDDEHFIYEINGLWQIRDIYNKNNSQSIEFINMLNKSDVDISNQWVWIDDEYFLLNFKNDRGCILSVATLQGIVKEIIRTDVSEYGHCFYNSVNINFPK